MGPEWRDGQDRAFAPLAEVVRLEVVRSFGETVLIRQIMNLRQAGSS